MRRPVRRFGILVLALALVPGQFSTADAGVIPWLYDAIFGPVGHYGYAGPYGGYGGYAYRAPYAAPRVSYAAPTYSPTSYYSGYRPMFVAPSYCSTGSCSTVLSGYRGSVSSCGTCSSGSSANSACAAKTAWKSKEPKEATTEWQTEVVREEAAVPTPAKRDEAPKPKTFAEEPADPSQSQSTAVEKVVTGNEAAESDPDWTKTGKPAAQVTAESSDSKATGEAEAADSTGNTAVSESTTEAAESAGFGKALRGAEEDVNKIFTAPKDGEEPAAENEAAPTTTPVLPEGLEGLPEAEPKPAFEAAQPLNLEEQSSLRFAAPVKRIAFRAGFRRARVARTSVVVNEDYVVPSAATWRLVSR